ncbi:MAG: FAD-dependent thymidylate synthase [Deltaproteobacteria bacterium]|nr:FAD-dependent thymidylate synthase [Deltaproteobacteria bacterium]
MVVRLLACTPDPEEVVAAAAQLCYSSSSIEQILEKGRSKKEALLKKILSAGHFSVLEHAAFTFGIEGISRACSHQLVRHRVASFSQQSQRYVSAADRFGAVVPDSIAADVKIKERFESFLRDAFSLYDELLQGGIPAEDARFVLPNAVGTKLVVTMNARELHHFFRLRCCLRAQWEIRAVAKEMLRQARTAAPLLFFNAGPGCVAGECPEGAMSCGRMEEVRRDYAELG